MDDILIRGGQVIDGTGAPARVADVAIRADRIVTIEAGRSESADRVTNCLPLLYLQPVMTTFLGRVSA